MKPSELRGKKREELELLESDLRRQLAEHRLKLGMGVLAQTSKKGQLRRDIARVLTILKEKEKS